jgi:tetratricopeptide (TPR) repeat protein
MLAAQKYDDAIRTIQKALDVMPGDSATLALLKQAEQAKKDQAAQIAKQEEAARQAEVVRLLKLAQSALAAKDLAAAAKSIDAAAKLAPRDPNVLRAQADLQKAQSDAQAAADALKKKMADFQALLTKARLAYQGKRYDDALAALADADRLIPNDKDALDLRRDVEKARADALGDAKKKADFQALVTKAKQSLAAKQYDQALAALADADRLIPGDRDLLALRKQVQSEKAAAEAEAKKKAEEAKRLAEYNKLMAQGQQSMNLKRYDDAVQAFAEALKVMPNDPKARAALADAQKALADSKKPKGPTPQEEYAKYMQAAAAAEKRQQWDDAIRNYQSALKFIPNDAKAMTGMRNAQLEQYLDDGQRALKSKKFADAVRSFEAALKIDPKNKEAQDGLKKAKSGK